MKNYAVLKTPSSLLGLFLNRSDPAALLLDKTFETSWEAEEYINSKSEMSDSFFYFVWFVTGSEIAMFFKEEEES